MSLLRNGIVKNLPIRYVSGPRNPKLLCINKFEISRNHPN
jgi:hypothetical protein